MREEIEKWMKDNDIMVLALQETSIGINQKEPRKAYTWYMSGETKQIEIERYTAGVGFVINNKFVKYVEDIIPHTDRIIQLKLKIQLDFCDISSSISSISTMIEFSFAPTIVLVAPEIYR